MSLLPANGLERLESRILFAVNVTRSGHTLQITGDDEANFVEVNGNGEGVLDVYVNEEHVGTFEGIKNIKASLGDGSDQLHLSAIQISGNVTVDMGKGNDYFDLDTDYFVGGEGGGFGDGDVHIGGNVKVTMGGNHGDEVVIDANNGEIQEGTRLFHIGKNLTIDGASYVSIQGHPNGGFESDGSNSPEDGDINIGRNLSITSRIKNTGEKGDIQSSAESGGSYVFLSNLNVGGKVKVQTGNASDYVAMEDSNVTGRAIFQLGGGDDELVLGANGGGGEGNIFRSRVNAVGGSGFDLLITSDPSNVFSKNLKDTAWEVVG